MARVGALEGGVEVRVRYVVAGLVEARSCPFQHAAKFPALARARVMAGVKPSSGLRGPRCEGTEVFAETPNASASIDTDHPRRDPAGAAGTVTN